MVIIGSPSDTQALRIMAPNVTLRNVVIYHAANSQGIYATGAEGLTLENVEVFAYGNKWGAQPCPRNNW